MSAPLDELGGFGQLKRQPSGIETVTVEDLADAGRQCLVAKHSCRQVHGHIEFAMVAIDASGCGDGMIEHEEGELLDAVASAPLRR